MCGVVKISSVIPQQATINEIASYSESTAADHASPPEAPKRSVRWNVPNDRAPGMTASCSPRIRTRFAVLHHSRS